jgi:hypothetical protein
MISREVNKGCEGEDFCHSEPCEESRFLKPSKLRFLARLGMTEKNAFRALRPTLPWGGTR